MHHIILLQKVRKTLSREYFGIIGSQKFD